MLYHSRKDDKGKSVGIKTPHKATPLDYWDNPTSTAIVTPDGPMPESVNGIAIRSWKDAPKDPLGWAGVSGQAQIDEPEFKPPLGKNRASGVVTIEQDGRVWLAAPSNEWGGYIQTFPKGTASSKLSLQANAIKEAMEESGLQVEIVAHLVDAKRDTSYTRYYVARRVGGNPADMGWESQAVLLAPMEDLPKYLNNPNDKPVYEALKQYMQKHPIQGTRAEGNTHGKADIIRTETPVSLQRIITALDGFYERYKHWPNRLFLEKEMWGTIKNHQFTDLGLQLFLEKLMVYEIYSATVITADDSGNAFEYQGGEYPAYAEMWLWGVRLSNSN